MKNEKDILVFIETAKIPRALKGKSGRDWEALFDVIPYGKSAIIPEVYGKGATIRQAVKRINDKLDVEKYEVTQRTENEKTVIYVSKLVTVVEQ